MDACLPETDNRELHPLHGWIREGRLSEFIMSKSRMRNED